MIAPVPEIVATPGAVLSQVPPPVTVLRVVAVPTQRAGLEGSAAVGLIVKAFMAEQPEPV